MTYDETMWQMPEEDKKEPEKQNPLDAAITDEIKEEEEGSGDSEDETERKKLDSPLSNAGSEINKTLIGEGDDNEDTFMSLDQALESEFDINKVSKLDQRLKDVNR